jgi:hypothetical protein
MAEHNHNNHHDGHNHHHDHDNDVNKDIPSEGAESLVGALRFLFLGLRVIMLILVVLLFKTGCFTVKPTDQVLTFRFGELLQDENGEAAYTSGQSKAFWVWPEPVGNTLILPSKSTPQSVETDRFWHQKKTSVVSRPGEEAIDSTDPIMLGKDGYVLTGDSYLFHIKVTMTFISLSTKLTKQVTLTRLQVKRWRIKSLNLI